MANRGRFGNRTTSRALLGIGLAVGLTTLLYSSWRPDTGRSTTEPVAFVKEPRKWVNNCVFVCLCVSVCVRAPRVFLRLFLLASALGPTATG